MAVIYEPSGRAREYAALGLRGPYKGCPNGCTYCYNTTHTNESIRRADSHEEFGKVEPLNGIVAQAQREARRLSRRSQTPDMFAVGCDSDGDPPRIFLSFGCDPYPLVENDLHVTRGVLTAFVDNGLKFNVLTKMVDTPKRDVDLFLRDGLGMLGATLTCASKEARAEWEPNAPSTAARIAQLRWFAEQGVPVWVSCEPTLIPEHTLEIIRRVAPFVDHVRVGKLNHHPHEKTVNWRAFGNSLVGVLGESGVPYRIKDDLYPYLPSNFPQNTRDLD